MSGISTDVEEHPANSRAGGVVSPMFSMLVAFNLHSSMIAMAMNIIST